MRWILDIIHLKWSDVIGQIRLSMCVTNNLRLNTAKYVYYLQLNLIEQSRGGGLGGGGGGAGGYFSISIEKHVKSKQTKAK